MLVRLDGNSDALWIFGAKMQGKKVWRNPRKDSSATQIHAFQDWAALPKTIRYMAAMLLKCVATKGKSA
jgi:hypothetical protein